MTRNISTIRPAAQERSTQATEGKQKYVGRQPAVLGLRERIAYRWLQGATELKLADEFQTRREMVEAIVRSEIRTRLGMAAQVKKAA